MIGEKSQPQPSPPRVVILGVGNILLKDEGVGVRVVDELRQGYSFPDEVKLIDGATCGLDVLPIIRHTEHLIIVDAVKAQQEPGAIFRLTPDELSLQIPAKNSLHQIGLMEALHIARVLDGELPSTVILGIEPEDTSHWGLELTPLISLQVPRLIAFILEELATLNVTVKRVENLSTKTVAAGFS